MGKNKKDIPKKVAYEKWEDEDLLETEFILNQDINTRDGVVEKGVKAWINEINCDEYDADGKQKPYKVYFDKMYLQYNVHFSDWFTKEELFKIGLTE